MNPIAIPWRVRMGLVVVGYTGVVAVASVLITMRYLAEESDPDMFNSGMAAGGDWFLELFLVGLLLIPTFLLALLIRNKEESYLKFAKILLWFGISAPVCIALMAVQAIGQTNSWIGWICLYRTFACPMTLVGFGGCWMLAKFKRARRLILYGALIEIGSIVALFSLSSIKG